MSNPKKVVAAFAVGPKRVGALTLLPPTLGHFIALEAAGNPFGVGISPGHEPSLANIIEAGLLLSKPAAEARALAADGPRLARETGALADSLAPGEARDIAVALGEVVQAAFATFLPPKQEGESQPAGMATGVEDACRPASDGRSASSDTSPERGASGSGKPSTGCLSAKPSQSRPHFTATTGGSSPPRTTGPRRS